MSSPTPTVITPGHRATPLAETLCPALAVVTRLALAARTTSARPAATPDLTTSALEAITLEAAELPEATLARQVVTTLAHRVLPPEATLAHQAATTLAAQDVLARMILEAPAVLEVA